MKNILKNVSTTVVIFALMISAFNAPMVSIANAQTNSGFSFDFPDFNFPDFDFGSDDSTNQSTSVATSHSGSLQSCDLNVSNRKVNVGGSVNLNWNTSGFDVFKLNGQTLSGEDGSITMNNILEDTTYELVARTSDGASDCVAVVTVECIETPEDCVLQVTKVVDKSTANVGDTLTYTLTVKNTGTSDCTGGGVKIVDVLSDKLTYLTQNTSGNITAGYGNSPVYSNGDRTLRFNGNTLNPNEQGTITVTARVNTPSSCGDYEIPNQAKATAKELNNFGTWVSSQTVKTTIDNDCQQDPAPSCDSFTANPSSIMVGGSSVLSWQTSNATQVTMNNGIGNVAADGSTTVSPTTNTTYTLTVYGTEGRSVNCSVPVTVSVNDPAPSCDSFTANPSAITTGQNATLAWQTSNATRVVINNGVGEVAGDGSVSVSPLTTTTYQLTVFGTQDRQVNCSVPVTVNNDEAPVCEYFTATPNSFGFGGGQVTLNWKVNNATNVSISPTIGNVVSQGSQSTNVTSSTNFVLTATDADGDQVSCQAPVTVANDEVLTCANNVSFTASDYSIDEGDDTTLNWNTSNIDSVSISVINSTALSGSKTVDPRSDTTYVLTARKGNKSVDCPLRIEVDEDGGGGGGGTPSPRCELTISDNKIRSGEQITLRWNTSNATEVTIEDNHNKTIMTTEKYLSKDKKDHYDGSIKLKPTRDTEYTLVAERGSKDRTCKVKVDVEDLTVITDRQPLVAGIALSNVPYTGFEAGPMLTMLFYALLMAWALFVTYLIVMRPRAGAGAVNGMIIPSASDSMLAMNRAETLRPDVFAPSVAAMSATATVPTNLPTGTPVIGYANMPIESENPHQVSDSVVTALENRAHAQRALLSSDAIRHFISTTEGILERNEALDEVIAEAKGMYPLEDGWIVINEARMQGLCDVCIANHTAPQTPSFVPTVVPTGSSSLAEAIVTGNVVAAYEMIGNRPMFALADAAADLDAVVRSRRGEEVILSELLKAETATLSEQTLKNMIVALTGALDGVYTDEASAVKMAIMKAVKEVA